MILLQSHLFIILSCLFTISQQEPIQCLNIEECIENLRDLGIPVLTFLFSIFVLFYILTLNIDQLFQN